MIMYFTICNECSCRDIVEMEVHKPGLKFFCPKCGGLSTSYPHGLNMPPLDNQSTSQVGGNHYSKLTIQPWDVIKSWGMGFFDGNAIKYLCRWKDKGGIEDLRKAKHYIEKLIEDEGKA